MYICLVTQLWHTNVDYDVCMFSNTTLTYKCWLEADTGIHIGLGMKCISIWFMLGVHDVYVICVNVDVLWLLCALP